MASIEMGQPIRAVDKVGARVCDPMPLGFNRQYPVQTGSQVFVPEGLTRVGLRPSWGMSPEGTVEIPFQIRPVKRRVSRPFGTYARFSAIPTLKRWAIFRCPSGTTALGCPNPSGIGSVTRSKPRL